MQAELEKRAFAKIGMRLIPFMILLYLVNFLDRVNIGFAALTMNKQLGFTPYIFGWGAGIFFVGYVLCEIPSNVALEKVGARLWIFRIMITWGVISTGMAFISGTASFLTLRLLLGIAEAGFFPGMILYLTYWFPRDQRAQVVSLFLVAIPFSTVIGGPLSGYILGFDGLWGLAGWQWLFIIEGLPACALAFVVLALLPEGPDQAAWLTAEEKAAVKRRLSEERADGAVRVRRDLWPALTDVRVLMLGLVYLGIVIGFYGIAIWLPQIVKAMGFTNVEVGVVVALPYLAAAIAMIVSGRHSDRTGERILHVAVPALVGTAGFVASVYVSSPLLALCALGIATMCIYSTLAPFWALPPLFLGGTAAAGGIALINSIGNLGGFAGPYVVGWIKEVTQSFDIGMTFLGCALFIAAIITLVLGRVLAPALSRDKIGVPG